jgi:NADPH:quinone reductase-like Zn-dependent oxidoreductase
VGAVPGHEFSGVVAAVGEQAGSLEIGQDVYGMNDWYSDGALAEYCGAPFFAVAPKPHSLTHAEAASVPISALTAWQGLFERAKLQPASVFWFTAERERWECSSSNSPSCTAHR